MSFRNTYVTDYIYCASDEVIHSNDAVKTVFERNTNLSVSVKESGYGYYAGVIKTSSGTEEELVGYMSEITRELRKVTRVPFRLTVMLESGPVFTYMVEPVKETDR
jgi:hypothetical protein